jgi:hypothetical protein
MSIPPIGSVFTIECRGGAPGPKFLDGRTTDGTVGLAANTSPSGTQWLLTMHAGDVITLKCMGDLQGNRYLDGRTIDGTVGLVPDSRPENSGTRWHIFEAPDGVVTLRCLGLADGNRYLDGRTMDGTVGLAPNTGSQFSGTQWRFHITGKLVMVFCEGDDKEGARFLDGRTGEGTVGLAESTHEPFVGTRWLMAGTGADVTRIEDSFTLKCLGAGDGPWYLAGDTANGGVGLTSHIDAPLFANRWMIDRSAGRSALKCLGGRGGRRFLDGRTHDGTVALVGSPDSLEGARWRILEPGLPPGTPAIGGAGPFTVRVAQLTGSNDAENRPVLNNTAEWGGAGMDLGANCIDSDGKIYIYLSDVVPEENRPGAPPHDADVVTWINAPILGGHEPEGLDFALPFELSSSQGEREWRYCRNCAALFFNGSDKGVCPASDEGHAPGDWKFAIPFEPTDVLGQREWRHCVKCQAMFFELFADRGVCAAGGRHVARDLQFVLPDRDIEGPQQATWRFCKWCRVHFFSGVPNEFGACVAGGTAFRLHPVMSNVANVFGPTFDPFTVNGIIDKPLNAETPTGTFSYEGQIYVFIWIGEDKQRPLRRQGSYLVSKNDPGIEGPYDERFLLNDFQAGENKFLQVAPWVIKNADIPFLPSSEGDGLLMFGQGGHGVPDAVHLAWMPLLSRQEALQIGSRPGPQTRDDIQYRTETGWSTQLADATALFTMASHYTSVSVAWLEGPRRWILLYSKACGDQKLKRYNPTGSVMARIGKTPWDWSEEEIEIFNPGREQAYGCYMHWPELGTIYPQVLPTMNNETASAYGAHLLNRFTKWHPETRMLDIYYLLSFSRPYQTQVMFTKMHIP